MTDVMENLEPPLSEKGQVNSEEFRRIVQTPAAVSALLEVGVEPIIVVDFADMLFMDSSSIPFSRFMEMLLDLRGANTATLKDVMNLSMQIKAGVSEASGFVRKEAAALQAAGRSELKALEQLVDTRLSEVEDKTKADIEELREGSSRIEAKMQKLTAAVQRLAAG